MKYTYDYFMFEKDVNTIISNIKKKYDYVVGIKRGGLIPAVCISHALHIPMYSLDWSNRDYPANNDNARVIQPNSKILLVDDICDTGETIMQIKDLYSFCDIDTAVLLYNLDQPHIPNYYGRSFSRKTEPDWIVFWWEDINTYAT